MNEGTLLGRPERPVVTAFASVQQAAVRFYGFLISYKAEPPTVHFRKIAKASVNSHMCHEMLAYLTHRTLFAVTLV